MMNAKSWLRRRKSRPIRRPDMRPRLERLEDRTVPTTFLVTNTGDAGTGSGTSGDLRYCITQANNTAGADTIQFAIASGPQTISLLSELPHVTDTVTIDGNTQPDFAGAPLIELTGATAGYANGLWLDAGASESVVRGLVINRFTANGIVLDHTHDVVIEGNYVGTNADGSGPTEPGTLDPSGNVSAGVILLGGSDNLIGGTTAAARNVISLNMGYGVSVGGDATNLHNVIAGNYIGLDASGTIAMPNYTGVEIENVSSGVPGVPLDGLAVVTGNVISGNLLDGILGHGLCDWSGIVIQGNFIGTNAAGTAAVGNARYGIDLGADQFLHVSGNIIGGTTAAARNVISGNGAAGIWLGGNGLADSMAFNTIQGNYIGTNAAGTAAVGNDGNGIDMDFADNNTFGGAAAGAGNVISGNGQNGIHILRSNHSVVQGNFIGTNAAATAAVGNGLAGVDVDTFRAPYYGVSSGTLVGGTAAGARNVIGGNGGDGVAILAAGYNYADPQAPDTLVQGNYIGTTADGTAALANGHAGIYATPAVPGVPMSLLIGGGAAGAGNLISGNAGYGVFTFDFGATVQGNRIGTNAAGTAAIPNPYGVLMVGGGYVGGSGPGEGNLVSGNSLIGVDIDEGGGAIQGNLIGTDVTGTAALGNGVDGIALVHAGGVAVGGTVGGARNIISGNGSHGILISGGTNVGNTVQGNLIGVNATGAALANGGDGVRITADFGPSVGTYAAHDNVIGGVGPGAGNVIAFNGGTGVVVTIPGPAPFLPGTTGNTIRGNSIFANGGPAGLGIDLGDDGVTPNDSVGHVGANNYQNFPVIASAVAVGGTTTITGSLDAAANTTFMVDIYASDPPGPSGHAQGRQWLGAVSVPTDAQGHGVVFAQVTGVYQYITATATDPGGNTSEFWQGTPVTAGTQAASLTVASVSAPTPLFGVDAVTVSAAVSAGPGGTGTPTGTVTFYDGATVLGTAPVTANGTASLALGSTSLAAGPHTLRAAYGGDSNFTGSDGTVSVNVLAPSLIHGLVWVDFNNDGQVDFGEKAVAGVTITLTGTDDLGAAVNRVVQTDANGVYAFTNLRPSGAVGYIVTESQPVGLLEGKDTLGDVNGVPTGSAAVQDVFSGVVLPIGGSVGENYNFGEQPTTAGAVGTGQTATIGFWQNKNGQNLIQALNGGSTATQLGHWLAATFPNMYSSLNNDTNAQVAAFYKSLFARTAQTAPGGPPKTDVQVMATALAVYVTNQTLAGTTATAYGFQVTTYGVGEKTFNVGSDGAAFGVANNSTISVLDLLLAVNARSHNGLLYDINGNGQIDSSETSYRTMANDLFSAINEAGGM